MRGNAVVIISRSKNVAMRMRTIGGDCSGASAAEFALIVPVLLVALFAVIKFGIILNNKIELTNGTRAGARVMAVSRGSTTAYSDAYAAVLRSAANTVTPTITFTVNGTPCSGNAACQTELGKSQGLAVSVSASVPCDLDIVAVNFAPNCQLLSQTSELIE
jgi:Flp pilus assembly protein TadG